MPVIDIEATTSLSVKGTIPRKLVLLFNLPYVRSTLSGLLSVAARSWSTLYGRLRWPLAGKLLALVRLSEISIGLKNQICRKTSPLEAN